MALLLTPDSKELNALFARRMSEVVGATNIGGRIALGTIGAMLTVEVKRLLSQPYPPASVPGEPPHQRRGEEGGLLGSYDYWIEGDDTVAVGSGNADPPELPVYLEFGTTKMKPRPHLRPAVANLLQGGKGGQVGEAFVREVTASLRRAVG